MSLNAVTAQTAGWALFLDVDGTLLDLAETPQSVCVPEAVKDLLTQVSVRLDGAVALVSGRSLRDLDQLFTPLRFCSSGVHGCEVREANGCVVRAPIDCALLDAPRAELKRFVQLHEGLLLEDKGYGLALHFRRVPYLTADALTAVRRACRGLGTEFMVRAGKCVFEIRPTGITKGTSIASFMQQRPFRDRTPVFIGDDVTDEDGFEVVNALGGVSIRVGETASSAAQYTLAGVGDVRRWLERFPPSTIAALDCLRLRSRSAVVTSLS